MFNPSRRYWERANRLMAEVSMELAMEETNDAMFSMLGSTTSTTTRDSSNKRPRPCSTTITTSPPTRHPLEKHQEKEALFGTGVQNTATSAQGCGDESGGVGAVGSNGKVHTSPAREGNNLKRGGGVWDAGVERANNESRGAWTVEVSEASTTTATELVKEKPQDSAESCKRFKRSLTVAARERRIQGQVQRAGACSHVGHLGQLGHLGHGDSGGKCLSEVLGLVSRLEERQVETKSKIRKTVKSVSMSAGESRGVPADTSRGPTEYTIQDRSARRKPFILWGLAGEVGARVLLIPRGGAFHNGGALHSKDNEVFLEWENPVEQKGLASASGLGLGMDLRPGKMRATLTKTKAKPTFPNPLPALQQAVAWARSLGINLLASFPDLNPTLANVADDPPGKNITNAVNASDADKTGSHGEMLSLGASWLLAHLLFGKVGKSGKRRLAVLGAKVRALGLLGCPDIDWAMDQWEVVGLLGKGKGAVYSVTWSSCGVTDDVDSASKCNHHSNPNPISSGDEEHG
ncbi:unnamed protein product, partial [Discosporangium mesarthrocarpum]